MPDMTIKRVEDFDSPNQGGFCRARASLGVTAFGMQVEQFPPHFEHHPEHDHAADGQEEVYTVLSGSATLHVGGEAHRLVPGVFARVGPGERRKLTTGDEPVRLLAIGGTPGAAYTAPAFTETGAPLPG
jgi:quercetin dioxygenase-like cupin family protein